jgi:hypothetical protein
MLPKPMNAMFMDFIDAEAGMRDTGIRRIVGYG